MLTLIIRCIYIAATVEYFTKNEVRRLHQIAKSMEKFR